MEIEDLLQELMGSFSGWRKEIWARKLVGRRKEIYCRCGKILCVREGVL